MLWNVVVITDETKTIICLVVVQQPSWKMMEFVTGKDDIPYMTWKIKFMFETTNQFNIEMFLT